jgi:hypothetical protein
MFVSDAEFGCLTESHEGISWLAALMIVLIATLQGSLDVVGVTGDICNLLMTATDADGRDHDCEGYRVDHDGIISGLG